MSHLEVVKPNTTTKCTHVHSSPPDCATMISEASACGVDYSIMMSAGQVLSSSARPLFVADITEPNDDDDDDDDAYDEAENDVYDEADDAGETGPGGVSVRTGVRQQSSNMEDSLRLDCVQRSSREQLLPNDWVRCTCSIGSYSCSCVW